MPPTYDDCDDRGKLRIDALILSAVMRDQPRGMALAMREAMAPEYIKDGVARVARALLHAVVDLPLHTGMLHISELRDALAALPRDKLPTMPETPLYLQLTANTDQQVAITKIVEGMSMPAGKNGPRHDITLPYEAQKLSGALIYQGDLAGYPEVQRVFQDYMAREAAQACTEKHYCQTQDALAHAVAATAIPTAAPATPTGRPIKPARQVRH